MGFLTPIIAAIVIAGTLGGGAYVESQAKDVLTRYNLVQVGHFLTIYQIEDGRFPTSLDQVMKRGEVKNINWAEYTYNVSTTGENSSLYLNGYCWKSEGDIQAIANTDCYPRF